jgi:hypothetical protein
LAAEGFFSNQIYYVDFFSAVIPRHTHTTFGGLTKRAHRRLDRGSMKKEMVKVNLENLFVAYREKQVKVNVPSRGSLYEKHTQIVLTNSRETIGNGLFPRPVGLKERGPRRCCLAFERVLCCFLWNLSVDTVPPSCLILLTFGSQLCRFYPASPSRASLRGQFISSAVFHSGLYHNRLTRT